MGPLIRETIFSSILDWIRQGNAIGFTELYSSIFVGLSSVIRQLGLWGRNDVGHCCLSITKSFSVRFLASSSVPSESQNLNRKFPARVSSFFRKNSLWSRNCYQGVKNYPCADAIFLFTVLTERSNQIQVHIFARRSVTRVPWYPAPRFRDPGQPGRVIRGLWVSKTRSTFWKILYRAFTTKPGKPGISGNGYPATSFYFLPKSVKK